MITVHCPTPADTSRLGTRLAAFLVPGDVVSLRGPLGAGKTLFVGGIAAGLGIEEPITSPSFVLTREYLSGLLPLVHADVFRLGTFNEFDDLDLLSEATIGVLVIEWGEVVEGVLPTEHLRVRFEVEEDETRIITLNGYGDRWSHLREVVDP
ncbi:MAG TPA: tRNA (adenosine(37)-N6)-threonylcarbamoyltransferase complex ATPase subunit type 1 TsaE [Acidimicrobiia bacterium]|nr:tRNA (adenosine(37)-N6)-threonylcarbamoyltransferase complex ATPase subunit type 1 TsaE [Acidimicrobiia bacterium]